jgi:hypothetical protein
MLPFRLYPAIILHVRLSCRAVPIRGAFVRTLTRVSSSSTHRSPSARSVMTTTQRPLILALLLMIAVASAASSTAAVPAAVAAYEKGMADQCREVGGKPGPAGAAAGLHPILVVHGDLNGDGIDDWAIDEGAFYCAGAVSIFGGSGGSQVILFVGLPTGDALRDSQFGAYSMRLEQTGVEATLWLGVGGPFCGQENPTSRADSILCERPLVWNKTTNHFEFAPLAAVRFQPTAPGK